ncbi:MAG: IS110 family transposase [Verrucomicrobia bacterium]|nr:IS110 family transposase [Verrucomicrobiota bacterium]
MKQFDSFTHFAGVDWAKDSHGVVVIDASGKIVEEITVKHTAEGWLRFRERLARYPVLAIAVESGQGLVIEQLLLSTATVYVVPAKNSAAYRTRKVSSGTKTDRLDAWCLACALRSEGNDWRPVEIPDELTQKLRLLCRDQVTLIGQRVMLLNQLQAALREYYPAALEAFDDWTAPSSWAFIEMFPDPSTLAKAGKRRWEKFLHVHRLSRPETYQKRMEVFARAGELVAGPAVTSAKAMLAKSLCEMLRVLQRQIDFYDAQIKLLFEQHPDRDIFKSLPGAGPRLAPRLLSEIGPDRNLFASAGSLQCYAGTAPVSYQSGQIHKVQVRRSCNKHLRAAVHLWAGLAAQRCPWSRVYYQAQRERGQSHACALRNLGQRWLKILWKMWQTGSAYEAAFHTRNQLDHGSWVLKINPT